MEEEKKSRIYWIDNARAIAIISMILYHTMWDLVYLYGVKATWYRSEGAFIWQQSICWTFIFLAGFCSNMSGNPMKHGLIISFWGIAVMAITQAFMQQNGVWFGILTLIGTSSLLSAFFRKYMRKIPAWFGMAASFICFFLTYHVGDGYIKIFGKKILQLPEILYQNLFTAFLGFPTASFCSTDYFPMLPWIFLFFTGFFAYGAYSKNSHLYERFFKINIRIPVFSKISKCALIIYILHQPIIYGILEIIFHH